MSNDKTCVLQQHWRMETGQDTLGSQDKPFPDSGDDSHVDHGNDIRDAEESDSSSELETTTDQNTVRNAASLPDSVNTLTEETNRTSTNADSQPLQQVQQALQDINLGETSGHDRLAHSCLLDMYRITFPIAGLQLQRHSRLEPLPSRP